MVLVVVRLHLNAMASHLMEIKKRGYLASEIKPVAIKVTQEHYPNTIQIGDVTKLHYENGVLYKDCEFVNDKWILGDKIWDKGIDILIGGSPCQDFSFANQKQEGLNGDKSFLFYHYLRLKNEISPKYFLLENVRMAKKWRVILSEYMGYEPIEINSNLVSYQNRHRLYWTNIPNVTVPDDKHISFQDYIDTNVNRLNEAKVHYTPSRIKMWNNGNGKTGVGTCRNITNADKCETLTRKQDRSPNSGLIEYDGFCRFLTRRELEMAQTLPEGYTDSLSYTQVQDVCGDGWTVDVIAHILSFIPELNK